ncbi:MAG: putative capsid protein [Circoviridae sp.]|nr:MAG: putative capsid protein [Circoviridae sp.]
MPYKKQYRRRRRARGRNRYPKRSWNEGQGGRITVFKNPSPLPMKFKAVLRYSDPFEQFIPPQTGNSIGKVFSCNGIYDPDITRIGHQPSGFDQLMMMYDHYVVIGAKITTTFVNNDNNHGVVCAVDVRDRPTLEPDMRVSQESGTVKTAVITSENSGRGTVTITYKVNPNRFLGRSKPLADPELKGDSLKNPNEQCYFHIMMSSLDAGSVDGTSISSIIEYQAIFIEPKPVGLS